MSSQRRALRLRFFRIEQRQTIDSEIMTKRPIISGTIGRAVTVIAFIGGAVPAFAQAPLTDGPYVTCLGDTAVTVRAVCQNVAKVTTLKSVKGEIRFTHPCLPEGTGEPYVITVAPPAAVPPTA